VRVNYDGCVVYVSVDYFPFANRGLLTYIEFHERPPRNAKGAPGCSCVCCQNLSAHALVPTEIVQNTAEYVESQLGCFTVFGS
jgi:hypothetical protein